MSARLGLIRWFCCIESSQDSCDSRGGVSDRSPPAAEAFIQTASATPAADALGWILPLLPCRSVNGPSVIGFSE